MASVQNRYNLSERSSEAVLQACEREGRIHTLVPAGYRETGEAGWTS